MRVLLLAENWKPRVGGIERYLEGITEALGKQGISVEVISPTQKRFFWPVIKPAWLPLFISLWKKAKRKEFEVLLCGKALFEGLVGYYLKKHLGIPYIVFTYAMEIDAWQSDDATWKKLVRVLSNADRVAYINEQTKKRLQELGVKDEQLLKVQPGIAPVKFAPLTTGQALTRRYVLSVGRLIPRKGFDTLIEAFGQLDQTQFQNVELWVVGDGPERQRLQQVAKDNFMEGSVKFLGQISDEPLQQAYAGAEVFALTPRDIGGDIEGFGIVYLEAALAGVPAVGTRVGGVPEAVVDNETGILVPPDNPAAVAVALTRLLANREQRDRLGKQAHIRAQEDFSWARQVAGLTEALTKITE